MGIASLPLHSRTLVPSKTCARTDPPQTTSTIRSRPRPSFGVTLLDGVGATLFLVINTYPLESMTHFLSNYYFRLKLRIQGKLFGSQLMIKHVYTVIHTHSIWKLFHTFRTYFKIKSTFLINQQELCLFTQ